MKTKNNFYLPLLALAALLCIPSSGSAQTVLGAAGSFVLLGATGVTGSAAGATFSNGNVGSLLLTSITNFPPDTVVNGATTSSGVAAAETALAHAQTALFNLSAGAPPANTLVGGLTNGMILAPGVYSMTTDAVALGSIITLNAQGKNDVTWVFNITGSLTTGANVQILFTNLGSNGGSDDGVFWNASSAITLGGTNVVAGSYLSGTSITAPTGVSGSTAAGSFLAQAAVTFGGAATMNALGGPGGGNLAGGLALNGLTATTSGYVLLSSTGTYSGGIATTLTPGTDFDTTGAIVDGNSANATTPASLTVFGTTATLTGVNTYTGGTIVDGGSLITGAANLPVNGGVTLTNSNATAVVSSLTFNQAVNGTFGGSIAGNGSVTLENTGALTLSGVNSYTGGTFVTGGTLIASSTALPTAGSVTLSNNSTLAFNQTVNGTFSGVIAGAGSVAKLGAATLTVSGVNTYTGGTTISAGTLAVLSPGTLGASGVGVVLDGGTLKTTGASVVFTRPLSLTVNNGGIDNSGNLLDLSGSTITGAARTLSVFGAGTTTVSAANVTGLGGFALNGGTLAVTTTAGSTVANNFTLNSGTLALLNSTLSGIIAGGGNLTFTGVGTLALTNPLNTFTGTLTAGAGSTVLGNSESITGNVNTAGTVTFNQIATGTYAGVVSGAGTLIKQGAASLALTGLNTYTGGTTISAGTLIASSAFLPANQNVAITGAGGLVLNQTANGTFGGGISGAGSLTVQGASTLTLSGANTYTGGTTVSGGTVVASSTTLPAAGNVVLANNSALVFNQAAAGTFSGAVTGVGTLTMEGAGPLTLTGASTVPLNLLAGSLYLAGAGTVGTTTVAAGAFIGGIGTINGNLINNGMVSPGDAPGTIIVAGNFVQGPGGTLVIQFASPVSFDKLLITGSAALAGTLQLNTLGGYNPAGQTFNILTAAGGVNGTFTPVTGSAALAATVGYGANTVTVSFLQLPFVPVAAANGVALTPNQTAVAAAALLAAPITTALDGVPLATQLPDALNALSPQGYEIWSTIAFAHATSLADRMERASNATPDHDNLYFDASQAHGREGQTPDVGQSDFTTTSGLVGDDHVVGPNLTLGGFFAYGQSEADLGTPGSGTTVKDFTLGARANWNSGPWFVHGVAAYDFDDYDGTRPVNFPGTSTTASSHTHGGQWTVGVSGGQNLTAGPVTLSPFVGVLASGWRADGFTESGAGVLDNSLANQSAHSLRSQLGVEGRTDLPVGSTVLQPHVRLAWLHEFSDAPRTMLVSFDGVGYGITTQKSQLDSAQVAVGLDVVLSPRALLYSDISVQTGSVTQILSEFRVGFSLKF